METERRRSARCPFCGSLHTERHGLKPGDHRWTLCRDCGAVIDDEPEKPETVRAKNVL